MEDTLFSESPLTFLKTLNEFSIRYMIVGMASVGLQGGGLVTEDVNLWFEKVPTEPFLEAVRKCGGVYVAPTDATPPMLAGGCLGIYGLVTTMHGLETFAEEYKGAIWVDLLGVKVPLLPAAQILRSKEYLSRPKDRAVLPLLRDIVRCLEEK